MKERTPQEQTAANRQIELLTNALDGASKSEGYWMNTKGKLSPKIYERGPAVSPFNALILGLFADRYGYQTNLYTTFPEVRKRGDSILKGERGVPFLFYRWDSYVNKHNASDVITRDEYKALPESQQALYKGVRQREVRTLFNIDQTTLPMADKDGYTKLLGDYGSHNDRGYIEREDKNLRSTVNCLVKNVRENLVQIRKDVTGSAHYDLEKDAIYMPAQNTYASYPEYVQDLLRQIVASTGHQERLARQGVVLQGKNATSEDIKQYERLVAEVASGIKMMELGLPARLSSDSLPMIESWKQQLSTNLCMIDALESDVNNALEVIRKAERGEKIEFASKKNADQTAGLRNGERPQVTHEEALIIQDILRNGGMVIDLHNFPGATDEEKIAAKKEFMDKFCNLEYYEGQLNLALWQAKENQSDPEMINVAYTVATNEASRIHRVMSEYLPKEWEQRGSHFIADEMMCIPDAKSREFMVIKDNTTGIVDVVLPAYARSGGDVIMPNGEKRNFWITPDEVMLPNERKAAGAGVNSHNSIGMNKAKIEAALMAEGATYVRFFDKDGLLRYRPDDAYFKDKEVYSAKLQGKGISVTSRFDVSDAVKRATETTFDRVQMLKDDSGAWVLMLKAENEKSFCIYPEREDLNRFFATIKQNDAVSSAHIRNELAQKYYALATANPNLKTDLFYGEHPEGVDIGLIERVNIFRTRDEKIMISASITGVDKLAPKEITSSQWQRLWVTDNVADYKTNLAAMVYADVLRERSQEINNAEKTAETVETEEQQNQELQNTDTAHADKERTEQAEEDKHESEQAAKEEAEQEDKDEERAAVSTLLTATILQQYGKLKQKHPDSILLFRTGDNYLIVKDDAPKAIDILKLHKQKATIDGNKETFAVVPHSQLDEALPKLVRAGERIAICEELDAKTKERVERSSVVAESQEEYNRTGRKH